MNRLKNFAKATIYVAYATIVLDREVDFDDPEQLMVNEYGA